MEKLKNILYRISKAGIILAAIILLNVGCDEEAISPPPNEINLQMIEYIELEENDTIYSEFKKVLELTQMNHLLKTRGPFTLFLPDNNAMKAFYTKNNVLGAEDLDTAYLKSLVKNHLIAMEIKTETMGQGSLSELNALGDFLVSEYDIEGEIRINKESVISDRDIEVANGIIHRVSNVVNVITNNTMNLLKLNGGYTIFVEALEKTGISDTLSKITIPYGKGEARVRYTIFAVPDSVYQRFGIDNYTELEATYGYDTVEKVLSPQKMYNYMDYHCIEGTKFLNEFPNVNATEQLFYTISRENQISLKTSSTDFMINYDNSSKEFTGLIMEESNLLAKNGVIHAISDPMDVQQKMSGEYIFYTTHYPDLMEEECYKEHLMQMFYDPDYFAEIKWDGGDYVMYYYKLDQGQLENFDCLQMSESYWWLEITIPKIKKGKYEIYTYIKGGPNRANCLVYLDGEKLGDILFMNSDEPGVEFNYFEPLLGTVEWNETTKHKIKMKAISPGIIMWDYVKFVRVEE